MGQMAGGTVTNRHRAMDIHGLIFNYKVPMAHDTEFKPGTNQANPGSKIMTVLTFFFGVRPVTGAGGCHHPISGCTGSRFPRRFRRQALLIVIIQDLLRRYLTWNPVKNGSQDFMAGHWIAAKEQQAASKKNQQQKSQWSAPLTDRIT